MNESGFASIAYDINALVLLEKSLYTLYVGIKHEDLVVRVWQTGLGRGEQTDVKNEEAALQCEKARPVSRSQAKSAHPSEAGLYDWRLFRTDEPIDC